jgi:hypothetical protein
MTIVKTNCRGQPLNRLICDGSGLLLFDHVSNHAAIDLFHNAIRPGERS